MESSNNENTDKFIMNVSVLSLTLIATFIGHVHTADGVNQNASIEGPIESRVIADTSTSVTSPEAVCEATERGKTCTEHISINDPANKIDYEKLTRAGRPQTNWVSELKNASDPELANKTETTASSLDFEQPKEILSATFESDDIPSWLSRERRSLLSARGTSIQADVTVAKDGSGKHTTINEALKAYTGKSSGFFKIYIKTGVYKEYVTVTKSMKNVMFIGDGSSKTKITGSKNFVDGASTMDSATVTIQGPNFMAKDIGFENSAGAAKQQAVALMVTADASVFYKCKMDGFQDTLCALAKRQFYRECTITGTIDFVFGDATAVFQNCIFAVRKPAKGQECVVIAQGRTDPNSQTGFVVHKSTFTTARDFSPKKEGIKVYLGRPWFKYSRTIIMKSVLGEFIHPDGWARWEGEVGLDTCFFAEYANTGPGADQSGRVKWKGIKKISAQQATAFTVGKFYQDNSFIKAAGVPFTLGL